MWPYVRRLADRPRQLLVHRKGRRHTDSAHYPAPGEGPPQSQSPATPRRSRDSPAAQTALLQRRRGKAPALGECWLPTDLSPFPLPQPPSESGGLVGGARGRLPLFRLVPGGRGFTVRSSPSRDAARLASVSLFVGLNRRDPSSARILEQVCGMGRAAGGGFPCALLRVLSPEEKEEEEEEAGRTQPAGLSVTRAVPQYRPARLAHL
ncbi:uncharacterized protein [Notamacropus eugenii]|uniref:uncharacterized protein n=1 Tax=Notamacropus eugenii TaxID=9315 RepID=UPI003B67478B